MITFPVRFDEIMQRIDRIDLRSYAKSRNYYDGAVSRLSPYISRGAISLPFLVERVLQNNSYADAKRFIYELAWREYFQRVWHKEGWNILTDMLHPQNSVSHHQHLKKIVSADTGITAIDSQIGLLYDSGYMHNHARMYVASITCNLGQAHWSVPAQWMYYYLLDGDLASNSLSWQWVAGTFSTKKYYCNQANINHFSGSSQTHTFLDRSYEYLQKGEIPNELSHHAIPDLQAKLPSSREVHFDYSLPLLLYNSYNLDPQWRINQPANRLLLLERSHFEKFPVSGRVIEFIISLSQNIPGIQILVGELEDLPNLNNFCSIHSKTHPAFQHYPGEKDAQVWMFPDAVLKGSFSAFWKSCQTN